MIQSTTVTPQKCPCGYGLYNDRVKEGVKRCPACDPDLGNTPEERIELYKKLIGTPINDNRLRF